MATVLRFPDRPVAARPARLGGLTAEVVILPCIRREPMGSEPRPAIDLLEQLQA